MDYIFYLEHIQTILKIFFETFLERATYSTCPNLLVHDLVSNWINLIYSITAKERWQPLRKLVLVINYYVCNICWTYHIRINSDTHCLLETKNCYFKMEESYLDIVPFLILGGVGVYPELGSSQTHSSHLVQQTLYLERTWDHVVQ